MNDTAYTLQQTNKERKILARSAHNKRSGAKTKKCTLPSDYMTPAQKRRLNGTMQTYSMNKPHTLGELKMWPADLRCSYMNDLLDRYNPSNKDLGLMLNCSPGYIARVLAVHFGIARGRGGSHVQTPEQVESWSRFMSVEAPVLTLTPDEPKVVVPEAEREPMPDVTSWPGTITTPSGTVKYETLTVQFTGTVADLLRVVATDQLRLPGEDTYLFTIRAARKEG